MTTSARSRARGTPLTLEGHWFLPLAVVYQLGHVTFFDARADTEAPATGLPLEVGQVFRKEFACQWD